MDKLKFQVTSDGSHTLYVSGLDETYHSKHGAIQEAKHVFIDAGLFHSDKNQLKILEIGFGTGLNTLLTLLEAERRNTSIDYTALEFYPLEKEIIEQLNYIEQLGVEDKEIARSYNLLHEVEWGNYQKITNRFNLKKLHVELSKYDSKEQFDLIYFDAFGPRVQPEMWSRAVFEKMYDSLSDSGILVTYCAKGSVKRLLKEIGFIVESLPGPPGKREMTRVKKC